MDVKREANSNTGALTLYSAEFRDLLSTTQVSGTPTGVYIAIYIETCTTDEPGTAETVFQLGRYIFHHS